MLKNVRSAVKGQKKIIFIFFLTIFLPSVVLSVFGVRAIRSERFRLARQAERAYRRTADMLMSAIDARLKDLESRLRELRESDAFVRGSREEMGRLIKSSLSDQLFLDQVFLAERGEPPWFPFFQPVRNHSGSLMSSLPDPISRKLRIAETLEFKTGDLAEAAAHYQALSHAPCGRAFTGRMLVGRSRCLFNLAEYAEALEGYQNVSDEYGDCLSLNGMPLAVGCELQAVRCRLELGDRKGALRGALDLFKDIVWIRWPLTEAQFKTYTSLVEQTVREISSGLESEDDLSAFSDEWISLTGDLQKKLLQWEDIRVIEMDVLPELFRMSKSIPSSAAPLRLCRSNGSHTHLVTALPLMESPSRMQSGLLGISVDMSMLREKFIPQVLKNAGFDEPDSVLIADLNGRSVYGRQRNPGARSAFTGIFAGDLPPLTVRIFPSNDSAADSLDLRKNFYLWTILTLMVALIFGTLVISRAIAQETAFLNMKSDFVASVSHEFKSPLTSIKSLSGRLRAGAVLDEDRKRQYFEVMERDADRLMRLVGNILDFSKIEEGRREFEFVKTDVKALLTEELEAFKESEATEGIKISADLGGDIPEIRADKDALSRAIQNLLDNALKFSFGKEEIRVSLSKDEEHVHISVTDRGIGIPRREQERIFEKFYQGRRSSHASARGTGLGLTLVKHTAEAHGGRIRVKSRAGEGSTFVISLPVDNRER